MKILMVGLGSIGQRHLRNILHVLGDKSVEISAFRIRKEEEVIKEDLTVEQGVKLSEKYRYTSYGDIDKALNASPDAVFICNPSSLHIPIALKAAKKGCHLFIEKPLSHNLDGIEELCSIVERKKLVVFVAFMFRFHPCFLKLKELLKEDKIGNLLSVRIEMGEYMPGWHKWEDYRRMYASRKNLGGGVILTQIHHIDYAMELFGMPKSIYALGGHLSSLEVDVEDSLDMLMECRYNKKLLPVYVHLDYLQRRLSNQCKVIGESGTIFMDFVSQHTVMVDKNGREEKYTYENFERKQLYLDELKHFFTCIKNGQKPLVDVKTAFAGMKMAMAAKEAMEKKKKVLL